MVTIYDNCVDNHCDGTCSVILEGCRFWGAHEPLQWFNMQIIILCILLIVKVELYSFVTLICLYSFYNGQVKHFCRGSSVYVVGFLYV